MTHGRPGSLSMPLQRSAFTIRSISVGCNMIAPAPTNENDQRLGGMRPNQRDARKRSKPEAQRRFAAVLPPDCQWPSHPAILAPTPSTSLVSPRNAVTAPTAPRLGCDARSPARPAVGAGSCRVRTNGAAAGCRPGRRFRRHGPPNADPEGSGSGISRPFAFPA